MAVSLPSCVTLPVTGTRPCITFPGGGSLCVGWPQAAPPSPDALMRQFMAQLSAALSPIQPVFLLMDMMAAVVDVLKALPKLDLGTIAKTVPKVIELALELVKMLPQVSIPYMIVDMIDMFILFLDGYAQYLTATSAAYDRLVTAENYANSAEGVSALLDAVLCGRGQLDAYLAAAAEGMGPINSLINALNALLTVIGLGKFIIPPLEGATADTIDTTIEVLTETAELLLLIRQAIPLP